MEQEVFAFLNRHQLIPKHTTVLVGVSGGPDSIALLHFLKNLQFNWDLTIIAVTVDHQLRNAASAEDCRFVEEICQSWGIPCVARKVNVRQYQKEKGVSEEVAARELRYSVYKEIMREKNAHILALGHHADDQIETMVMRLARIATSNALKGIPVRRKFAGGEIIRPLLGVTKNNILDYLGKYRLHYRTDKTNEDDTYTRNYYRMNVVPLLKKKNPNLQETIQTLSETLSQDEQYMQAETKERLEKVVEFRENKQEICFAADAFLELPQALQRRGFHLILNYLYGTLPKDLSYIHEVNFFDLLRRRNGSSSLDFPSRLRITNEYGQIHLQFGHQVSAKPAHSSLLTVPGEVLLSDGTRIESTMVKEAPAENEATFVFPLDSVSLPLHIRARKAGDRMSVRGLNGSKKLKDIFIDAKIPKNLRDNWPIIADDKGVILWVVGLKKSETVQNGKGMNIKLKLHRDDN
ncbi:tRNA lysidine(34) synthetase TilS [Oceanobacillus sp. J11TS1]|uniref:tRNA lysidine(34) synthetase TilS n=1 Tax=Oceanobacillus sp. J11TS1 TaxID=2807191 RepID=UPI001B2660A2|nr:tRNA lysidine(34) synthetase TilS [Oceanobacillus sp. J11TS1]GIO24229.1 tRNA(Ile)-lysidine synthase [Oceanobacillus sp. J11TS1]